LNSFNIGGYLESLVFCFFNFCLEDTLPAVKLNHLNVVEDFGDLRMNFTVQIAHLILLGLNKFGFLIQDQSATYTDCASNNEIRAKHVKAVAA
jgi:hypothetical protein